MFLTELKRNQSILREELGSYTNEEIIKAWVTIEHTSPYDPETSAAWDDYAIKEFHEADEQERLELVYNILEIEPHLLRKAQLDVSQYAGKRLYTKNDILRLRHFIFEHSVLRLFKEVGLKR